MGWLSTMKSCFWLVFAVGCAQPSTLHPTSGSASTGSGGHHDGGLMFDDGGAPQYQKADLAGNQPPPDLAEPSAPPDLAVWHDLAIPPGVDLATLPDLAHSNV